MKKAPRLFGLLFGAFLLSQSGLAFADPSLADKETARSLMDEGDGKRDKGDWKGALKAYEAADAIMKVPTTGLEVARAQVQLGLLLEARETLGKVMKLPIKPAEPAPFTQARKNADTLNTELTTRIPSIQVNVANADPNQTQISVDGENIPPAAAQVPRKVNPGSHAVVVKVGTFEKKLEVTVAEREAKVVPVDAKENPPAPPPPPVIEPPPKHGPSTSKILMFGGFGLGIVGVGVGTVTGLISLTKTNELKDQCPEGKCALEKQGEIDSAKSLGNISTVAFIVGGVGVGVGVVGLIMSRSDAKEKAAPAALHKIEKLEPVIGLSYVGLKGAF